MSTKFDNLFNLICEKYNVNLNTVSVNPTDSDIIDNDVKLDKSLDLSQDRYFIDNYNGKFPEKFLWAADAQEFIYDILPYLAEKYDTRFKWETVQDLQAIPELVTALKNTNTDILIELYSGIYTDIIDKKYLDITDDVRQKSREVANWIKSIALARPALTARPAPQKTFKN